MKREEEINKQAEEYGRTPVDNIEGISGFKVGAKWADKTMIERACKYLLNIDYDDLRYRDFCEGFNEELFVNDFRKAMEG